VKEVRDGQPFNIGKRQKPIPGVYPTQTASLNLKNFHLLKNSLITPIGPLNRVLKARLYAQRMSNGGDETPQL